MSRNRIESWSNCLATIIAEHSAESLTPFDSGVRNPLHALYASGDMLERKLTDPALLTIASRIKTNVRRMSSLIDDVLDFARGRLGGGIGVELTQIENINTGLTAVVQEIRDAQPECEIISHISVSRSVRCDLGRIVEPFWRHSVSASRNGLGLGLHICSQIVRAHQGRISVTSTREGGTQFTARLPLSTSLKMNPASAGSSYASADDNLARPLMPTLQHLSPGRLTVEQTGAVDREAADLFLA
jgi:signal transduction histidine kinase